MAPKRDQGPDCDPDGMFAGMVVRLLETGVQNLRLQIWKQKLWQMGATVEDRLSTKVTHVFATSPAVLLQHVSRGRLAKFKGKVLVYQWIEDSLKLGAKVPEDSYEIKLDSEGECEHDKSAIPKRDDENISTDDQPSQSKKIRSSPEEPKNTSVERTEDVNKIGISEPPTIPRSPSPVGVSPKNSDTDCSLYIPPDLNQNITEIFRKLINIYRACGQDRRSFSYSKAIAVIEKLPYEIQTIDQVKDLPNIGISMREHIMEIVTTGKLSKLDNFERDEKVQTINLFGEVWGIGPATALKLYEKGYRTLDDLKNETPLTNSQKLGLKYFDDIKQRIPRHEVQEMELLLQKAGEDILPGVSIVCGGSYRRGKASCGDMDIIITHPDGQSHRGFLPRYVKVLKDMGFLREDLIFSTHSEEDDSGVDTYFGLCTYPGRELRHRIDLKVYPRDRYAFGLVAWTGNDVLNRRLRLLAASKGYRLDDTGLFAATKGSDGRGLKARASLKISTEEGVFSFLGFPWLEPHDRNL